jgi:hypothetical protein
MSRFEQGSGLGITLQRLSIEKVDIGEKSKLNVIFSEERKEPYSRTEGADVDERVRIVRA